jgi:hypothetical protein
MANAEPVLRLIIGAMNDHRLRGLVMFGHRGSLARYPLNGREADLPPDGLWRVDGGEGAEVQVDIGWSVVLRPNM